MDKINVQKSICRITFVQKRAALGNLRNFFGGIFVRAYMVRRHAHPANTNYRGWGQKGGFGVRACPFLGHSCFREKAFRCLGTVFGGFVACACPFLGHSCFREKAFRCLGTVFGGFVACACPFLGHSCFPGKSFWRFGDCLRRVCRACMSLFGAFLFLGKSFPRFWD
jgi:hypothetical protein